VPEVQREYFLKEIMKTNRSENGESTRQGRTAFKVLIGGMLGMVVAMGIGRFVFTPILPLMQRDLGMSNTVAGWLAGLNYLGYLGGAIICSIAPQLLRSRLITGGALLTSLATTMFMGGTLSVLWWGVMRLGGGVASAILFIVISAEVAETLTRRGYGHWVGTLYGGVGFGIALSGLIVPQLDKVGGWAGSWIGMGVLATMLAITGISLGRKHNIVQPVGVDVQCQGGDLRSIRLLAGSYFFQGLGYIVTATFIVAIVAATPGLESFAAYSWVAVGLAAVPSTVFWPRLARRIGNKQALLAAYMLQAAGILVSMYADSVIEVLFAAISFGGTFLGIVALTLAEGNLRMAADGRRAAAVLTASFGVGQMLGPIFAGRLADLQEGFALSLLLAAACVMLGGIFIAVDRRYHNKSE
jgi:MFS family permease